MLPTTCYGIRRSRIHKDARSKVCRQCVEWQDKKSKFYKYEQEKIKFPIYPLRANNEFYFNEMFIELTSDNHTQDVVRDAMKIGDGTKRFIHLYLSDSLSFEVSDEFGKSILNLQQASASLEDFKRKCLNILLDDEIRIEVQEALDNRGRRLPKG